MLSNYKLKADILTGLMKKIIAKKKYGQNFLIDENILNMIIQSMPKNNNHIVEIGPGLGDLTEKLVKYKDMTAYEVDADLISILKSKFAIQINMGNLTLVHNDVLKVWNEQTTLYNGKYDLIANLPYYIATNIILRALEDDSCEHIIVMIQKEVAQKFTATAGQKDFSSLAIITENLSDNRKILFDVPPASFNPPPKVMSSVLYIKKNNLKIDKEFTKFLKTCFTQPRKKLLKNLLSVLSKEDILNIFKTLKLDPTIRPHEVSSFLYSQLYTKVKNERNNSKQC